MIEMIENCIKQYISLKLLKKIDLDYKKRYQNSKEKYRVLINLSQKVNIERRENKVKL